MEYVVVALAAALAGIGTVLVGDVDTCGSKDGWFSPEW